MGSEPDATHAEKAEMARSFGQAAGVYEQGRPDYPADAAEWIIPPQASVIADVGAGTGKFTRTLAATGHTVIAVDPDEQMLATLRTALPGVTTLIGTGEALPLGDHSVDVVTFAQSWHWVDVERGSREVARVLTPGGVLGLIWNIRDERVPWVAQLGTIMKGSAAEQLIAEGGPQAGPPFGPLERWTTQWSRQISVDDVLAMAASRSYVITAPRSKQEQIARDIRELLATDPATSGRTHVTLPYVTYAYRTTPAASR